MSDNVLAVGLFWRNDRGAAEVVQSEQTSSSYINLKSSLLEQFRWLDMKWIQTRAMAITIAAQFPNAPLSASYVHAFISFTYLFCVKRSNTKNFLIYKP